MSLGDFSAIGAIQSLTNIDNQIFWIMWIWTVIVTCIIFLNFVVCEACASYARIKEIMEQVQIQSQAFLITESEEMKLKRFISELNHPRYLVTREIDWV